MNIHSLIRLRLAARRIPYASLPSAPFRFLARTDSPAQNARSLILVCGERFRPAVITGKLMSGTEAEALMYALVTGHPGTLCSLSQNGAQEANQRLTALRGRSL
ncbi:CpaF/VirB11 family protein [Rahnella perminowiae]|uniref:CpaF/VirB11 family protein n=1 Tax=Rahnella perminowiae TaxID=2816244 RepID=UPI00215CB2CC|nr:CpaF/VirB11 family protein [Rahnella perminowiae]MCR8998689.1 CpaF/VirB11 family protein [Rahnella perminowiae]MCR8998747.1 CpaF/VirB11 family protein [Rahnella perminowiae]